MIKFNEIFNLSHEVSYSYTHFFNYGKSFLFDRLVEVYSTKTGVDLGLGVLE